MEDSARSAEALISEHADVAGSGHSSAASRVLDRVSTVANETATGSATPRWTQLTASALALLARATVGGIGPNATADKAHSLALAKAAFIQLTAAGALRLANGLDRVTERFREIGTRRAAEIEQYLLDGITAAAGAQEAGEAGPAEGSELQHRRLEAYATALEQLGRDHEAAEALFDLGNLFFQADRYDEALPVLRRALLRNPEHTSALATKAEVLRLAGRARADAEALEAVERSLQLKPEYAWAHAVHGQLLSSLERYDEAATALAKAIELSPEIAQWHYLYGDALRQSNKFDEALASFDRALAAAPNDADAVARRAEVLRMLRRSEESLSDFDRALAIRPGSAWMLAGKGASLYELGRFEEAEAALQQAIANSESGYVFAATTLAHAFLKQGRGSNALEVLDRALENDPRSRDVLESKIEALYELDRVTEGLQEAHKLFDVSPDAARGRGLAGALYYKAARYAEATREFERSVELDSTQAWTHNFLAVSYLEVARTRARGEGALLEKALAASRAAIALEPESLSFRATYGAALWWAKGERRTEARSVLDLVLATARQRTKLDSFDARDAADAARLLAFSEPTRRELFAEAERYLLDALSRRDARSTSVDALHTKFTLALTMLCANRVSLALREYEDALKLAAITHEEAVYRGLVERVTSSLSDAREDWAPLREGRDADEIARKLEHARASQAELMHRKLAETELQDAG